MVLHVAIEGIDGVGKSTMVDWLVDYYLNDKKQKRYNYRVRKAVQPVCTEIIDILKNYNLTQHEIALLMAFDRSFSYYNETWDDYDLIFWDRSILSSYAYNTNKNTSDLFIKQINRYFPEMDLYIIITTDNVLDAQDYTNKPINEIINKYNTLIKKYPNTYSVPYIKNNPEAVFQNILKTIQKYLNKCKYCGKHYKASKHYKKYDTEDCKRKAWEDQNINTSRTYYKRYKNTMSEKQKGALGSKGANLHAKPDPNPIRELEKVRNAKRAIGL